jgi:hypothetical protein
MYTAYAFKAENIQEYILSRTRMREMVGASSLIDSLSGAFLDRIMRVMEKGNHPITNPKFCRRGGGSFSLLLDSESQAIRLRNLVCLLLPHYAPGLRFVDTITSHTTSYAAITEALEELKVRSNHQCAHLPMAGPLVERVQRTDKPAIKLHHDKPLDREALVKSCFSKHSSTLTEKFGATNKDWKWPRELSHEYGVSKESVLFPFEAENNTVGIIHIDGNGFGQALVSLRNAIKNLANYAEIEHSFSRAIEQIGQEAAREATQSILSPVAEVKKVYPGRPLILGGDDLTMIVRGDLALPFVQSYIKAFEEASWKKLAEIKAQNPALSGLPNSFTACAGLVYIKAKYPFYKAYQTSEMLCKRAKIISKKSIKDSLEAPPSAVAWLCENTYISHDYGEKNGIRIEGSVYSLGSGSSLPTLANLLALHDDMRASDGMGGVEELYKLMASQSEADHRYAQWRKTQKIRNKVWLEKYDYHLQALGVSSSSSLYGKIGSQEYSPLGDMLNLMAVNKYNVKNGITADE